MKTQPTSFFEYQLVGFSKVENVSVSILKIAWVCGLCQIIEDQLIRISKWPKLLKNIHELFA